MKLTKKFMLGTTVQLNKVISSQIAKVKIYVMYAGKNRNQTHFTKEMIEEKLIPSIYGMPIIGEYLKEKQDFGGHGGKVTIQNGEIEYEQTTVAYGFIPESADVRWEMVTERDGMTQREYLVVDGYVWYKRFPELEVILDEPRNQSMEIEIKDAFWNDELNAYDILDAEMTGLAILGLETEPCFESARIGKFALENMKFELGEMAKELKETLLQSEVTEEMDKELETQVEETVETPVETVEEETQEEQVEETQEATEEVEVEETYEDEESPAIEEEVATEEETTEEEPQEEVQEEATEEVVEEVVETTEEVVETAETVDFAKENAELKATIEAYEAELAELRAFKAEKDKEEKQEVVDSFKSEFTEEELEPIVSKMDEFSKEDLEIQLFALLGKKKKQYSAQNVERVETEKVLTMASYQLEDETLPAWARAIEQHTNK